MDGTIHLRVAKTAKIEGAPKTKAVFTWTNPCLNLGQTPTKLLNPTINREYAVASTGSTPKRYTKTGTVKMEPPPPIKPKDIPITIEANNPKTIIP
jgi:hypothetical protein